METPLVPETRTVRRRNLPLIVLSLAPAMLLAACNTQEKQELAAAIARADEAAQRAENAQHAAEAAATRARTDKLAAARDDGPPVDEQRPEQGPEALVNPVPDNLQEAHVNNQPSDGKPS